MTTALYRRYRPEKFAEVIGQEHVTAPLRQALRTGRVNHAYLFSGPRGCGKTTSARILARTLNCARNTAADPADEPCGECASCVELARDGSGSLDVVEIDAASHGGVEDARELRERITFAPTRDRFKVYIIDEAHMVTPQGFNALLKVVEEPPPHVKFIFATTEPGRVLPTIRSRTHHYPFRLVPPEVLGPYLDEIAETEGFRMAAGVAPMVLRAGGGSVRDTLSVLDQLVAGAPGAEVTYQVAVDLLGFTSATLLDDAVDAITARDGAALFRVIEQVIATGHPPQRFAEDLLTRYRDLIVIAVSGTASGAILRGQPAEELRRLQTQAARGGISELSRAADLVSAALAGMSGATSPRLHLELLGARLLAPAAGQGGVSAESTDATVGREQPVAAPRPMPEPPVLEPVGSPEPVPVAEPSPGVPDPDPGQPGPITGEELRRRWDSVVAAISRPVTRAMLAQNPPVLALDGETLTLGFRFPWMVERFSGEAERALVEATLLKQLGVKLRVAACVQGAPAPAQATSSAGATGSQPSEARPQLEEARPRPESARPAEVMPGDREAAASTSAAVLTGSRLPTDGSRSVPQAATDPVATRSAAASDADAAWLAGEPMPALPPPDDTTPEDPVPVGTALAGTARGNTGPSDIALGETLPTETQPSEATQQRGDFPSSDGFSESASPGSDFQYDYESGAESSDDLVAGEAPLVGVPAVLKHLEGTIIEEYIDDEA